MEAVPYLKRARKSEICQSVRLNGRSLALHLGVRRDDLVRVTLRGRHCLFRRCEVCALPDTGWVGVPRILLTLSVAARSTQHNIAFYRTTEALPRAP